MGDAGTITISSGTVTAIGGTDGTGIGSGECDTYSGDLGNITIYRADVVAWNGGVVWNGHRGELGGIGSGLANPSSSGSVSIGKGGDDVQTTVITNGALGSVFFMAVALPAAWM
jgi:hypothetical protein